MLVKSIFAGFGGQGVLTMGNILGHAAMLEDKFVTYLPSYGAEVRGGTANCTICISDEEIASPVASAPDFLVALNQPSIFTFINRLNAGGQLLYNSDLTEEVPYRGDIDIFAVPATKTAENIKLGRAVNMVMLGCYLKLTEIVKLETIHKSLKTLMGVTKKKALSDSLLALEAGYNGFPFDKK